MAAAEGDEAVIRARVCPRPGLSGCYALGLSSQERWQIPMSVPREERSQPGAW